MASRGRKRRRNARESVLPGLEEFGTLEETLRGLAAAGLSEERRASLHALLRRRVTDPGEVSRSPALPAGHPLREEAEAVAEAFATVTSRTVEDSELRLACVSRRSPFAPWKHLIRAVAAFYRWEDGVCRRCLEAIEPDSAPARLVPALRAALRDREPAGLEPRSRRLVGEVTGKGRELARTFDDLDSCFRRGRPRETLGTLRRAVEACSKLRPDLLTRLRQHAAIRCRIRDFETQDVRRAIGGPSLRDSHFWRLLARVSECEDDSIAACIHWDEFRRQAIHEGILSPDGIETAAVYLHMATLAGSVPRWLGRASHRHAGDVMDYVASYYEGQPEPIRAAADREPRNVMEILEPTRLYEKAAALDPSPEVFRAWLAWEGRSGGSWKSAEKAALAWHEADPRNVEPLLELVGSAAKRNAYSKALKYLQLAERADEFHPRVRGARLRLGLLTFSKHVHQKKPHLAAKDIAKIAETPEAKTGTRPALLSALRWLLARNRRDTSAAAEHEQSAIRSLGTAHGGALLLHAVSALCRQPLPWDDRREPAWRPGSAQPEDIAALGRTCALAREVSLWIRLPEPWNEGLVADVTKHAARVDPQLLRAMAEVALDDENAVAAYALSGAGLRVGGALVPRFLMLRARALPPRCLERAVRCLSAASALAGRRGDRDVLDEIGRARGEIAGYTPFEDPQRPLDPAEVDAIVESEAEDVRFPARGRRGARRDRRPAAPFEGEPDLAALLDTGLFQGFVDAVREAVSQGALPAELSELDDADFFSGLIPDLLGELLSSEPEPRRRRGRRRR